MAIPTGLCAPWVEAADVLSPDELTGLTEAQADGVAMLASEVLYVRSNRYWPGVCERTVRPDLGNRQLWWAGTPGASSPWTDLPWWAGAAAPYGSRWFACNQANLTRFKLPGPVQGIDEILVAGTVLNRAAYRIVGRNAVQRVDGERWPLGQDLTGDPADPAAADDSGCCGPAWSVTYDWGEAPPASGQLMCSSLLRELIAALTGCAECRFPWAGAVATVTRKNTTINYQSLLDKFPAGYVGLADVDLWLDTVRGGPWRPRRPRIIRADARPRRSESTWATGAS